MRLTKYNFLFVIGMMLTLGLSTAFANDNRTKAPKNMGTLSIETSPVSYPVKIDGEYKGMSGIGDGAEFYLAPGFHTVEVAGPNGKTFVKEIEIRRGLKHCVCLKMIEETVTKACPYRFALEGPDRITEGDLVTFAAINSGTAPIPINYAWRVSPDSVLVTSGLGTPTITVDSKGMGGRTINAELDVNDDVYDGKCRQVISVPTEVGRIPEPPPIERVLCDQFEARAADDDKARFDNCVIMAQNTPDSQLYVIIYPGTDRASMTRNTYERLSKRTLDYMVKNRGMDPSRIRFIKGSPRTKTAYEIFIVPTGAEPPGKPAPLGKRSSSSVSYTFSSKPVWFHIGFATTRA